MKVKIKKQQKARVRIENYLQIVFFFLKKNSLANRSKANNLQNGVLITWIIKA